GSVIEEHTPARRGSEILWDAVTQEGDGYINALGALTGNQAVQQVRAGLKAVYLSGWQVAGDANLSGHTYPDQSLYPANSVPNVVQDRKSTRLNSSHVSISYAVFCLKKKRQPNLNRRRSRSPRRPRCHPPW